MSQDARGTHSPLETPHQLTADDLAAAQVAFDLASTLVREEPTGELLALLAQDGMLAEAPFGQDNPNVERGLVLMRSWLADAHARKGDDGLAELRREWLRLIAGLGTPEVPSWESYYTASDHRLFSERTVEVRELYARHGLQAQHPGSEPDDHLGLLLQFLAHLAKEESEAASSEDVALARGDARLTLERHVLPWLPAWYEAMMRHAGTDYYKGVANLTFGLVQSFALGYGIGYYRSTNDFHAIA